ncbi:ATP-dependent dethiobiotin synthetase BioD [Phyllobacterium salinisoli]|uniref:ATP-dependent dethiobiotin synthetase BioD n=1 Tax=Phyllobacterium salinisoli TaxID=1899321 RepID=A0A368JZD8_9HYPH|nr:dethiobiotin synthase [Phyllobacterium salinisoli]RCS22526.1 ATP-dependent dethiobiotin synthetase BioD [Phyllobacterium salinisoli]
MNNAIVVTGTDTGIGKSVFAAGLATCSDAAYWKPIQSGLEGETDKEMVARLGGLPAGRIYDEAYRLCTPASPHRAAELDGVEIDPEQLAVPPVAGRLIIEGAGGLLVPLTRRQAFLDVFVRWNLPVVLCARTTLGTINHTLLSLRVLRLRAVRVIGVAFIGDAQPDTESIIGEMGKVRILGRLPWLQTLNRETLRRAFEANFNCTTLFDGFTSPDSASSYA